MALQNKVQPHCHSSSVKRQAITACAVGPQSSQTQRAVCCLDVRPCKTSDDCSAGCCCETPWNTHSLSPARALCSIKSVRGALDLLCAASRDTVDLFCVESRAVESSSVRSVSVCPMRTGGRFVCCTSTCADDRSEALRERRQRSRQERFEVFLVPRKHYSSNWWQEQH